MTTLKVVTFRVECALTGEVLSRAVFIPELAEEMCTKIKRKRPSAFVKRLEP